MTNGFVSPRCLAAVCLIALAGGWLNLSAIARADELLLKDGSNLVGVVQDLSDGKLVFQTRFAGAVSVDSGQVLGLTTISPYSVALRSGERLVGVLTFDREQKQLAINRAGTGLITINMGDIVGIWAAGKENPTVIEQREEQAQAVAAAEKKHAEEVEQLKQEHEKQLVEAAKKQANWSGRLELGLNGQTGTTESVAFIGRAEARRETDLDRLLLYIQALYKKDDGRRTANEVLGGVMLEVDLTERLYTFGKIEMEYDEIEDLDLRLIATAGLGYFFIREPDGYLKGRLGAGFQHESFSNGESNNQAIGEAGFDYRKELAPWLLFTHSTTYYPTFDSLNDYRLVFDTAGEIPLNVEKIWKLKLGMRNTYDSIPQPGVERLDTFYYASLVFDFK